MSSTLASTGILTRLQWAGSLGRGPHPFFTPCSDLYPRQSHQRGDRLLEFSRLLLSPEPAPTGVRTEAFVDASTIRLAALLTTPPKSLTFGF